MPITRCYRHCEEESKFVDLKEPADSIVGAYVCPGRYVSRVVYFADNPYREWFEGFLRDQVGEQRFRSRDVRLATRHGWELGKEAEERIREAGGSIKQYYWVFYPLSDEEKKYGTFLCPPDAGGCNRLFSRALSNNDQVLCRLHGSGR